MKSFYIFGVLLLSVVKLKAASVSESTCQVRNLTVTGDDDMKLYIDGVEITGLPNAGDYETPDVVALPCTARLIAIHGSNVWEMAGILASTDDDYVLTNSSWKCSNISQLGWEQIDFDDSTWVPAVEHWSNIETNWMYVPEISSNAFYIWLRQWDAMVYQEMDAEVYCRKVLEISSS